MVNIIILHEKGQDHWPALGSKDIKLDVTEVWDRYIKNSDPYYVFKMISGIDDIDPKCEHPSTRPASEAEFAHFQGCLFNLDLYNKNNQYITEEIKILIGTEEDKTVGSISKRIYVGGVSRSTKFNSSKNPKNFHPKSIGSQVELGEFLDKILVGLITYIDSERKQAILARTDRDGREMKKAKGVKMDKKKLQIDMDVIEALNDTLNLVSENRKIDYINSLVFHAEKDLKKAKRYALSAEIDLETALKKTMKKRDLNNFYCIHGC